MDNQEITELRTAFESHGPWITRFEIGGECLGGSFDAMNDPRITQFFELFPHVRNIVELGSLEGGHSFALAGRPQVERVVAIEGRQENIDRSTFIQQVIGDRKVEFINADIEKLNFDELGKFDAVFCSGLLYHLPRPWELIPKLARISPNIFIWTQISEEEKAKKVRGGTRGKFYREGGFRDPLSGLSRKSFWMSLGSLMTLLTSSGFVETKIIEHNLNHPKGHSVTLGSTMGTFKLVGNPEI